MNGNTMESSSDTGAAEPSSPFELDIRLIETGDAASRFINLTDDGCGSSCPNACATNVS